MTPLYTDGGSTIFSGLAISANLPLIDSVADICSTCLTVARAHSHLAFMTSMMGFFTMT